MCGITGMINLDNGDRSAILHRMTGVAMSIGLVVYALWLMAAAGSPDLYGWLNGFFATVIGQFMLIGWSFAFFLHLANGIRHLVWDAGKGIDRSTANTSGWFIVVVTIVATAAFWGLR